jgi:hypothetical protein
MILREWRPHASGGCADRAGGLVIPGIKILVGSNGPFQ